MKELSSLNELTNMNKTEITISINVYYPYSYNTQRSTLLEINSVAESISSKTYDIYGVGHNCLVDATEPDAIVYYNPVRVYKDDSVELRELLTFKLYHCSYYILDVSTEQELSTFVNNFKKLLNEYIIEKSKGHYVEISLYHNGNNRNMSLNYNKIDNKPSKEEVIKRLEKAKSLINQSSHKKYYNDQLEKLKGLR